MVRGNPPPVKTGVFNKGFNHPSSAGRDWGAGGEGDDRG